MRIVQNSSSGYNLKNSYQLARNLNNRTKVGNFGRVGASVVGAGSDRNAGVGEQDESGILERGDRIPAPGHRNARWHRIRSGKVSELQASEADAGRKIREL